MTLRCRLTIPALPVGPNGPKGLLRMHWARRAKYNESWKWLMLLWVVRTGQDLVERGEIRIHQYRKRLLDIDNLYASCKPVIDALKGLVIVDDSPDRFSIKVTQEKGGGYIVVEVWE